VHYLPDQHIEGSDGSFATQIYKFCLIPENGSQNNMSQTLKHSHQINFKTLLSRLSNKQNIPRGNIIHLRLDIFHIAI